MRSVEIETIEKQIFTMQQFHELLKSIEANIEESEWAKLVNDPEMMGKIVDWFAKHDLHKLDPLFPKGVSVMIKANLIQISGRADIPPKHVQLMDMTIDLQDMTAETHFRFDQKEFCSHCKHWKGKNYNGYALAKRSFIGYLGSKEDIDAKGGFGYWLFVEVKQIGSPEWQHQIVMYRKSELGIAQIEAYFGCVYGMDDLPSDVRDYGQSGGFFMENAKIRQERFYRCNSALNPKSNVGMCPKYEESKPYG